jgi:CBS domain-containing membrane protein
MAHPWSVVGGNTLSALVAVRPACTARDDRSCSSGLAVAAAIARHVRAALPASARRRLCTAGRWARVDHASFAMVPMLLDSLLLVAAGIAYNHATGRAYPQRSAPPAPPKPDPWSQRRSFTDADLDAVLARHNQVLDVSREDLRQLLEQAQTQAWRRLSGQMRCGQVMSRAPVAVSFGMPLQEAWALLRQHRVKALPVVDRAQRVVGIVTLADFMREAGVDRRPEWAQQLREWLRASPASHSDKPEVVGQIMSRQVRVVSADRPIGDLLPLFASTGHHHVPVLDAERRLVGIITQSDVVRALARLD